MPTTSRQPAVWAVIPARGGSVGVPRKNLRVVGGVPLIVRAISTAVEAVPADHVVVVTDDREIAAVSREQGVVVILEENKTPGSETLDTKIIRNLPRLRELGAQDQDAVLTLQPTSPLMPSSAITRAAELLTSPDTSSVLTVTDSRHLEWVEGPNGAHVPAYEARVNRQSLPARFRETGGVIGARLADIERAQTRVIEPVSLIELSEKEGLDIDSFADLYAAAHLLTRLRIAIRTDAAASLGMGHVYRSLAISSELARHDLRIFTSASMPLGGQFFSRYPYQSFELDSAAAFLEEVERFQPDLVIFDVLDTSAAEIDAVRQKAPTARIATFEDAGTGAFRADAVISEFVPIASGVKTSLTGIGNAILAPAFEIATPRPQRAEPVLDVVVLFGGTDPSGLALRALDSLERCGYRGRVTIVRGLGASPFTIGDRPFEATVLNDVAYMPGVLKSADFAFTSAGRTIIELAQMGVPSICLAQNDKELGHTHATASNGVDMLGLGAVVGDDAIDAATARMLNDSAHRSQMRAAALSAIDGRSNHRTLGRMFDLLGFDPFPNL